MQQTSQRCSPKYRISCYARIWSATASLGVPLQELPTYHVAIQKRFTPRKFSQLFSIDQRTGS